MMGVRGSQKGTELAPGVGLPGNIQNTQLSVNFEQQQTLF